MGSRLAWTFRIFPTIKGLFIVNLKDEYRWGGKKPDWETWDIYEEKETTFTKIPEDVACEALRILETHEMTNLEYNSHKRYTYNDWAIIRDYNFDYQGNINYLRIDNPSGASPIVIKWGNGEDLGGIYEGGKGRTIDVIRGSSYDDSVSFVIKKYILSFNSST